MNKKALFGIAAVLLFVSAHTAAAASTSVGAGTAVGTKGSEHNTATTAEKIACLGKAVTARETAIDAAMSTFNQTTNTAYIARASALSDAYNKTNIADVKAAVKTAWTTFTSSTKTSHTTWQTSRNAAWTQFRKDAAACKAPGNINDSGHSGAETSGN